MAYLVKHKKYFTSLNMFEDETIKVYTFSIVDLRFFGDKCSTKSEIGPFPDYSKWHNKSLQTGLGYDINKTLDPVHQDIKMIVAMQYHPYPLLRSLAT